MKRLIEITMELMQLAARRPAGEVNIHTQKLSIVNRPLNLTFVMHQQTKRTRWMLRRQFQNDVKSLVKWCFISMVAEG